MKKILLVTIALLSTGAFAKAHGPAGCGLGAILFEGKEGVGFQVLAATFNGSSGNQTFGMSTGTLGCEDAASAKVAASSFIEANRYSLASDVARGSGETLAAYLELINAKDANKEALQKNYASIFSTDKNSEEIHLAMVQIIKE